MSRYIAHALEVCLSDRYPYLGPKWLLAVLNLLAMSIQAAEKGHTEASCKADIRKALTQGMEPDPAETQWPDLQPHLESLGKAPILTTLQVLQCSKKPDWHNKTPSSGLRLPATKAF